MAGYNTTIIL